MGFSVSRQMQTTGNDLQRVKKAEASQVPPNVSQNVFERPKRACTSQYFVQDVSRGLYLLKTEVKDIEEGKELSDDAVVFLRDFFGSSSGGSRLSAVLRYSWARIASLKEIKNMHKSSMMFNEVIGSWRTVAPGASLCSTRFGLQTGVRCPPTPSVNLSACLRAALTTLSFLVYNKRERLCVGTFAWRCCLRSTMECHSPMLANYCWTRHVSISG